MSKWTRTAGLIFLAAASVYSNRATLADEPSAAPVANEVKNPKDKTAAAGVKVLEESADPFANGATPTTKPAPTEGKSVSASEVNVSDAGAVEIHVNDANLIEVLRML